MVPLELPGAIALLLSAGTMPRDTIGLDALTETLARAGRATGSASGGRLLALDAALAVHAVARMPWLSRELARALQRSRAALDGESTDGGDPLSLVERRAAATYWGSRLASTTDPERHERTWSQLFHGAPWDVRLAYERAIAQPLERADDALAVSHALAAVRYAGTGELAFHARRGITPMASHAAASAATIAARSVGAALWPDLVAHLTARVACSLDQMSSAALERMPTTGAT